MGWLDKLQELLEVPILTRIVASPKAYAALALQFELAPALTSDMFIPSLYSGVPIIVDHRMPKGYAMEFSDGSIEYCSGEKNDEV